MRYDRCDTRRPNGRDCCRKEAPSDWTTRGFLGFPCPTERISSRRRIESVSEKTTFDDRTACVPLAVVEHLPLLIRVQLRGLAVSTGGMAGYRLLDVVGHSDPHFRCELRLQWWRGTVT